MTRAALARPRETADDASGAAARAVIETFIRETLRATSPDAYAVNELAALNRRRPLRVAFAPYGSRSVAGPGG